MKNLNEYSAIELSSTDLQQIEGGIIPVLVVLMFAAGAAAAYAIK